MTCLPQRLATMTLALVVAACGLFFLAPAADATTWDVPAPKSSVDPLTHPNEYANRVMARINQIRHKKGLKPVPKYQSCLDHKANSWAVHIKKVLTADPTIDLASLHRDQSKILKACNLHWAGECMVLGTGLMPRKAVSLWMHSKTHRQIIMKKRANRAGVGMATNVLGVVFVVLNFGDPT